MGGAARDALLGDAAAARRGVAEALSLDRGPGSLVNAARVTGFLGDTVQAQALVEEARRRMPATDTLFHAMNLPQAQAAIALGRNAPDKAVEALVPAAPYERGKAEIPYLRGLACLRTGRGVEAIAEFQKIIDHPGWSGRAAGSLHVAHPLARLGLARAAALAGDTAKSRRAYQDFLALWKDADPDVPVLVQARAEYAKLAGP
jgi:eukaryotic-like serine/threonine-protein kinase